MHEGWVVGDVPRAIRLNLFLAPCCILQYGLQGTLRTSPLANPPSSHTACPLFLVTKPFFLVSHFPAIGIWHMVLMPGIPFSFSFLQV